jgi:hypothetical protein
VGKERGLDVSISSSANIIELPDCEYLGYTYPEKAFVIHPTPPSFYAYYLPEMVLF